MGILDLVASAYVGSPRRVANLGSGAKRPQDIVPRGGFTKTCSYWNPQDRECFSSFFMNGKQRIEWEGLRCALSPVDPNGVEHSAQERKGNQACRQQ